MLSFYKKYGELISPFLCCTFVSCELVGIVYIITGSIYRETYDQTYNCICPTVVNDCCCDQNEICSTVELNCHDCSLYAQNEAFKDTAIGWTLCTIGIILFIMNCYLICSII